MSLCDLSVENILPTRTRSGGAYRVGKVKPFFEINAHQFTSFQDARDWSFYYLTKLREVMVSYINVGVRTRELNEYVNRTRDTIYRTLLDAEKVYGSTRAHALTIKQFLDNLREEVCEPLKKIALT
jgi:hypothetical protein